RTIAVLVDSLTCIWNSEQPPGVFNRTDTQLRTLRNEAFSNARFIFLFPPLQVNDSHKPHRFITEPLTFCRTASHFRKHEASVQKGSICTMRRLQSAAKDPLVCSCVLTVLSMSILLHMCRLE
ncbi:hypothetical protein KUCAC02_007032, partial [Chaenocephalus aceratus]